MYLVRLLLAAFGVMMTWLGGNLLANDLPLWDTPGPLVRIATYLNAPQARTVEDSLFPELRPRYYSRGPSVLFLKIPEAVATLPRWAIVDTDPETRTFHAVVTSAVFGFQHDVLIRIVPEPGRPAIHVQASARVGRGDLGANTRHILDLYAALDAVGLRGQLEPRGGP